jgi:hypothetical protein
MHKTISQTIADLCVLAKVVDSEDAERIFKIIERLQGFDERDDEQNNIYVEICRS